MQAETHGANWLLGLLGAAGGGALGYFAFKLLLEHGLYGLAIPGAALGLGCGLLSKGHSQPQGVVCAVLALALGLYSEWRFFPFMADESLGYFLTHVHQLKLWTLIMLVVGTLAGYWFGRGRERFAWSGHAEEH